MLRDLITTIITLCYKQYNGLLTVKAPNRYVFNSSCACISVLRSTPNAKQPASTSSCYDCASLWRPLKPSSNMLLLIDLMRIAKWPGEERTYCGCKLSLQASEFGFQLKQSLEMPRKLLKPNSAPSAYFSFLTVSIAFGASDHTLLDILFSFGSRNASRSCLSSLVYQQELPVQSCPSFYSSVLCLFFFLFHTSGS